MEEAKARIQAIVSPPMAEVGKSYPGRVVNLTKFGAFVNILPGRDGLVHISKLGGGKRIDSVESVLSLGDEIEVRVEDIDPKLFVKTGARFSIQDWRFSTASAVEPGGATTMVAPVDQRRIAELGAEVIRQAGVLDRAALIVERQADPYRPHRGPQDDSLPLESRIIKVVNAYDDLVGASLESDRKLRAIERLQLGIDREYDPDVVDTLSRIIERQSEYAY